MHVALLLSFDLSATQLKEERDEVKAACWEISLQRFDEKSRAEKRKEREISKVDSFTIKTDRKVADNDGAQWFEETNKLPEIY